MLVDARDPYHPITGWFRKRIVEERAPALIMCQGLHVTHHHKTGEPYRAIHERAITRIEKDTHE